MKKFDLQDINASFVSLSAEERIAELYEYFEEKDVLYTSSFGTTAIYLLHLISRVRPNQKIHFLNTTYHFAETIEYKNLVQERFNLPIVEIFPDAIQNKLTKDEDTYKDDPDLCCMVNKIVPIDSVKKDFTVWLSGLIGYQTRFRAGLNIFEHSRGIIKFNPLIDLPLGEVERTVAQYDLPEHPLKAKGYQSVGCEPCTIKGEGRDGRWKGSQKTECGLHTHYQTVKC